MGVLRAAATTRLDRALLDSAWRRARLLILCYHGISLADEHEWSDLFVTADHLAARLGLLRDWGCEIVPFSEGVRRLYDGTLPRRSVAVTFDDGFADFFIKGMPILREFATPTTLYLTTYYTAVQRPVFDPLLSYLLWRGQGQRLSLSGPFESTVQIPPDVADRERLHATIMAFCRKSALSSEDKDHLADNVAAQIGFDIDALRERRSFYLMSPDEIRSLDRNLIDVQLHTHRHRTPRDEHLFTRELTDNRNAFSEMAPTRPHPVHFCYPSGDYDATFLPWLRNAGVVSATTCDPGFATSRHEPLLLPRFLDHMRVSEPLFRGWLTGMADLLPKRSRMRGRGARRGRAVGA